MLSHIQEHYPHLRLIVEAHTALDHPSFDNLIVTSPGDETLLPLHTSLVLTLGGDGTILHVSNLFSQGECPPVLSFSMGSLGFLLPFRMFPRYWPQEHVLTGFADISALASALENTLKGPVSVLNRMRLACKPIAANGDPLNRCTESGECRTNDLNFSTTS